MRHSMTPRIRPAHLILGLALLATATAVPAQPPLDEPPGEPFDGGRRLAWLAEKLELSDAQREELRATFREEDRFQSWQALAAARRALEEQIHADPFDENAVREAAAAVAAVEAELAVARARHAEKMRQILTPEQLAELGELRAERHRFRAHHGRHGPPGRGRLGPSERRPD